MDNLLRCAPAQHLTALVLAMLLVAPIAVADPAELDFDTARRLALESQPLLQAQRSAAAGARSAAVAAGQLPDPTLVGGVTDLTLTGSDRFTLTAESDTQFMLGVKQMVPGGNKRELRGQRGEVEVARLEAELSELGRMAQRETGLAWLDVWKAERAQTLVQASITEAERQSEAVDIAYRSARANQADLLASRVSAELLRDQLANLEQEEWHARNQLRRWIGSAAERGISEALPAWPTPDGAKLMAALDQHPHVASRSQAVMLAQADLDLAKADYRPDWSVQAGYGYRPEFADYVSLQFEMALPYFTANRQDKAVDARAAEVERARDLKEDLLRQDRAAIQRNLDDWQRLQARFKRYDETILPQAQQRFEAALAAYGSAAGPLLAVLDARRSLLEIRMQRLNLELDASRHQVEFQYFSIAEAQP